MESGPYCQVIMTNGSRCANPREIELTDGGRTVGEYCRLCYPAVLERAALLVKLTGALGAVGLRRARMLAGVLACWRCGRRAVADAGSYRGGVTVAADFQWVISEHRVTCPTCAPGSGR